MENFKFAEKMLKRCLKQKIGVTTALVVSFLITGGLSQTAEARDLRNRITPSHSGPTMSSSSNGTDVININDPRNGISHNKYDSFNVGDNNNVIFNNSQKDGTSVTGGDVKANPNLTDSASIILNEVHGNSASDLNGGLEVFGKKADLVIANENGINVNGAKFINTSALTLSTGKVQLDNKKIYFDTSKNNSAVSIKEKGLQTDSGYLNVISRRAEINGKINSAENAKTNINIIAGANEALLENGNVKVNTLKAADGIVNKTAVSGSEYGAMYGNNIFILSSNDNEKIEYFGGIEAKNAAEISSKGKVVNSNIKAKNIKISSETGIDNTGKIKAEEDVKLDAPLVRNLSRLEGHVSIEGAGKDENFLDRNRGIIYYDFYINIKDGINLENGLTLSMALIEAGRNVEVNNNIKDGSFENLSGDIKAGKDIKVKGDFKTRSLSEEIKLEDILSKINVDLRWEHRSLVDNAYFNGNFSLKDGNLLDALKLMTDSKNKEYYTALKQIKDPNVNKLLTGLLGADWKSRETIKPENEWNKDSTINFYGGNYSIQAGENIKISGKNIDLGNRKAVNRKEIFKVAGTDVESIQTTLDEQENSNMKAGNIFMEADNINNTNVDITANENLIMKSKNDLAIEGAAVKGDKVLLEGEKINLVSQLGYDKDGNHVLAKKAKVDGKQVVQMKSKELSLYGADINTDKAGIIKVDTGKLNVKDISKINTKYNAELKEGEGVILKDHKYIKELQTDVTSIASQITGDKVLISAENDVDITGSLISGKDKESLIQINSKGNVNIKNTNNLNYKNSFLDGRGKNEKGIYKLVTINKSSKEELSIVGSELKTEGNINIKSKNIEVTSSTIKAGKDNILQAAEDVKLMSALDSKKEEMSNLQWGSGSILSHTESLDKKDVNSTVIEGGKTVDIHADKDIHKQSMNIKGGSVDIIAGGDNINDAAASTEVKKTTDTAVGVGAEGSVGFAGMGATGKANTIDNTVEGKTSGIDGLLEDNNEWKEAHAKGKVYAEVKVDSNEKNIKKYENSKIIAAEGDVNIKSNGVTDLGNTDIEAKKDINAAGKKIETTTKEDIVKNIENKADIVLSADVNASDGLVNKVNGMVNDGVKIKDLIETGDTEQAASVVKDTVDAIKDMVEKGPALIKEDVLGINADQSLDVDYKNTTSKISETTGSSLKAGGNINIGAGEGDVTLKNTDIQGKEVKIQTLGTVHLEAGEKTEHKEENGFNTKLAVKENIGINAVDGATVKAGTVIAGNYVGGTDLKKESLNSNIIAEKTSIDTAAVQKDDKTESHYKDKREAGINAGLDLGVSSNHLIVADGTVGGNAGYSFAAGDSKINVDTNKTESKEMTAGGKIKGSVKINGEKPDFALNTDEIKYTKDGKTMIDLKPVNDLITKEKIDKIISVFNQNKDKKISEK